MGWRATDNPEPRTVEFVVAAMARLPVVAYFELIEGATNIPRVPLFNLLLAAQKRELIESHDWMNLPYQVIILSPLGAAMAGVRLSHDSQAWIPDHLPPLIDERRIPRDRKARREEVKVIGLDEVDSDWTHDRARLIEYAPWGHPDSRVYDPHAVDPLDALIAAEELERLWQDAEREEQEAAADEAQEAIDRAFDRYAYRKAGVVPRGVPPPRTMLEGRTPWPPEQVNAARPLGPCPVHTERDMQSLTRYCLWCDASGADRLIRRGRPLPKEPSTKYEPGALAGGTGKKLA